MYKLKQLIIMFCLILSGALCYAYCEDRTKVENEGDGIPIEVIEKATYGGLDKSSSIIPTIDGHTLTVVFNEDLGPVCVEVTTNTYSMVDTSLTYTPNGILFYIPSTGEYIVTFTLPNGDEYYGEFTVTE